MHPLDGAAIGLGLLLLVFSFFAYYTYHPTAAEIRTECDQPTNVPVEARGVLNDLCSGASAGAWHGFFGWAGVVLGLVASAFIAVTVFSRRGMPSGRLRQLALGAATLGLVSTLVALLVVPDWPEISDLATAYGTGYSDSAYNSSISDGHGFSYWVVLISLGVLAAVAFVRARHAERPLSARG